MEKLNERISSVINNLGMKKTAFAERLNVSQAFISQLCSGAKQPSHRTISDICREFNVNKEWLRTGEGEMFVPIPEEDEIAAYVEVLTQGNRVKKLRKELGYTLDKFGTKLGVHKSAISKIEKGENNLTEQMFLSICREFHVNQEWLRTGEGEMFVPALEEDAIAAYIKYLLSDNSDSDLYNLAKSIMLIKSIMCIYNELSPKSQEILRDAINKLVENLKKEKGD